MFINNCNLRKRLGMSKLMEANIGDGNGGAGTGEGQQAQAPIDYDKLAEIINKGTQSKENAILKSYFEQQGMSQEDITQAIKDFKTNKQAKAQQEADNLSNLQKENEQLKAQILQDKVNNIANQQALKLGLEANVIPYVTKLANLSKVANDKGEIDEKLISEALNKVLTDIPNLKPSAQQQNGFTQVGASGGGIQTNATNEQLSKIFGNK